LGAARLAVLERILRAIGNGAITISWQALASRDAACHVASAFGLKVGRVLPYFRIIMARGAGIIVTGNKTIISARIAVALILHDIALSDDETIERPAESD